MKSVPCRERVERFWRGEAADRPAYLMYALFADTIKDDPMFKLLLEKGLAVGRWIIPYDDVCPDVKWTTEKTADRDVKVLRIRAITPAGEVWCEYRDGWIRKYFLETASDYRVMTWMAQHTTVAGRIDREIARIKTLPEWEVPMLYADKSPFQDMLVVYAGLENFALHLVDMEDEVMSLYDALLKRFEKRISIVAQAPGAYVEIMENFSADMAGAERYREFILPVYERCFGILHDARKIVAVHCDGKTKPCKELIAAGPIDIVESLTEPPEGDMPIEEARLAWPDKRLWCNIRVGDYDRPPKELAAHVVEMWRDGASGGRAMAFEMSEYLPANWRESVPAVLDALGQCR